MLKIFNTLLLSLSLLFSAYGQQNDARAQKIIDDMTAKFKTYPSLSVDFSLTLTNIRDNTESEQTGKIWIKGEKYKLEIPDFVLYFDGTRIYQYMPNVNEVNIVNPEADDEEFQLLNPQTYLSLSSRHFTGNFLQETTLNSRAVFEIDLYPVNFSTSPLSRIRIMVEKSSLQLVYMKAFMKNGIHYTLNFKPYNIIQSALRDSFFVFNRAEHPNVEVIDLTF